MAKSWKNEMHSGNPDPVRCRFGQYFISHPSSLRGIGIEGDIPFRVRKLQDRRMDDISPDQKLILTAGQTEPAMARGMAGQINDMNALPQIFGAGKSFNLPRFPIGGQSLTGGSEQPFFTLGRRSVRRVIEPVLKLVRGQPDRSALKDSVPFRVDQTVDMVGVSVGQINIRNIGRTNSRRIEIVQKLTNRFSTCRTVTAVDQNGFPSRLDDEAVKVGFDRSLRLVKPPLRCPDVFRRSFRKQIPGKFHAAIENRSYSQVTNPGSVQTGNLPAHWRSGRSCRGRLCRTCQKRKTCTQGGHAGSGPHTLKKISAIKAHG